MDDSLILYMSYFQNPSGSAKDSSGWVRPISVPEGMCQGGCGRKSFGDFKPLVACFAGVA